MTEFKTIRYEGPAAGVARITLDRPDTRNAQDKRMLYELNDAYDLAAQDNDVAVIVLAAEGPHFSSGHDLRDRTKMREFETVSCWGGFGLPGAEGWMAIEQEIYLGLCWRWRNLPKPTIASVQGKVIAGGLMLIWVCDLIICADNAQFSDPVVAFGLNGHEYFTHPWEVGPRKAKEMLFTGDAISATEAKSLGMVNHVVPLDDLSSFTTAMAEKIATRPTMGLKLAKQAVNQSLDAQGQWTALQAAFSLHEIGHSHNQQVHHSPIDPAGIEIIRAQSKAPG